MLMARLHVLLVRLTALVPELMFGAAMAWVMAPHAPKRRAEVVRLFDLMTGGDLIGLPFFPPRSKLQLLPFLAPQIRYWRRRLALWDEEMEGLDPQTHRPLSLQERILR